MSKSFPGEENKVLNQQQNDPNRPYLRPSHDSNMPEEATKASPVVENATSTGTKTQISEKKTKVQNTPTFGDLGRIRRDGGNSDRIGHAMDHEQEAQLECLDWDSKKLEVETQFYLDQLDVGPPDDDDDDKFWAEYEEPELTQLKERLALYRIIAHKISKKKQPLDDVDLKKRYTPPILKEQGYFEGYELSLEWYFSPEYCMYVGFQDYQRLVLRDTNDYHKWKRYCKENSTYEADREFVKFYEKLASQTKWIERFLIDKKLEWGKIKCIALYQAAKIATGFENIYRPLLYFCFTEFTWSVWFDYSFYWTRARLFFEIWKRVAKQKMNFKDALKQIYEQDMFSSINYEIKCELECNAKSGSMKVDYDTYTAHIEGEVQEDKAFLSIMERIKKFVPKLKTYYDYVKKKLHVAEKIRLIPPEI
ncbi:unnamed protein product [Urochloa decumbens]|uniref:Uncharacterized protein n=1 Tax=Urochloa decumbens TaxID=240449 RepID=A0ABC9F3H1_9POAL